MRVTPFVLCFCCFVCFCFRLHLNSCAVTGLVLTLIFDLDVICCSLRLCRTKNVFVHVVINQGHVCLYSGVDLCASVVSLCLFLQSPYPDDCCVTLRCAPVRTRCRASLRISHTPASLSGRHTILLVGPHFVDMPACQIVSTRCARICGTVLATLLRNKML